MTSKQKAAFAMIKRVVAFLSKYETKLSGLSALTPLKEYLNNHIEHINSLKQIQATDITGLAKQKQAYHEAAAEQALVICNALIAFAKTNNDSVLAQEVNFTDTKLYYSSDDDFETILSIVENNLDKYMPVLSGFGVTTAMQADFKVAKTHIIDAMNSPKEGTTNRKQSTTQISMEFENVMEQVAKVDLLIGTIRLSMPDIYNEYQDIRKVVVRTGTLSVKVQVNDAATKAAIAGAHVRFLLDGTTIIDKPTAEGGGLSIKTLDENSYTVIITKMGYQTQSFTFNVTDGDSNLLEVALKKTE